VKYIGIAAPCQQQLLSCRSYLHLSFPFIVCYTSPNFADRQYLVVLISSNKMRIGVISDTHLNGVSPRLIEIYEEYFSELDMIIHAGDLVSMEVADFLSQKPIHVVQGNMDTVEIRERFPQKKVIEVSCFRLGLIHGWGSPFGIEKRIRSGFDDVHAIIYGHSHRQANHTDEGVLFFNPGTAMGFSVSGSNSVGILDVGERIEGTIIPL